MAEGTPKDFVVKNGLVVNSSLIYATAGKVGVNNTSPIAELDVTGNLNVNKVAGAKLGFNVTDTFTPVGGVNTAVNYGLSTGATAANRVELSGYSGLSLFTNSVERITVDAGGNVGISNNNPNAKLQVTGTANIDGVFRVSGNLTATGGFVNVTGTLQGAKTDIGNTVITGTANVTGNVSITGGIVANGSIGTAGQALYSNSTGIYWGAVIADLTATYAWTNTHTFAKAVNVTGTLQGTKTDIGNTVITGIANVTGNVLASGTFVNVTGDLQSATLRTGLGTVTGNLTATGAFVNVTGTLQGTKTNIGNTVITGTANVTGNVLATGTSVTITGDLLLANNNKQISLATVNTSAYVVMKQQSDDNFVFYTTNTAYLPRPVFSIFSNSATSNLTISVPLVVQGNSTLSGAFVNVTGTLQGTKTDVGNTVITGTANVTGNVLASGTFVNVTGDLQSATLRTGLSTITGNITATGAFTNVTGTFQGTKTDIGNTVITGTANVTGNVLASGTFVNVTGDLQSATLRTGLSTVTGNITATGAFTNVTGTLQGTKTDIGNTVITGTANVTGNVLASGTFVNVTGTLQGTKTNIGNTVITGTANVTGNVLATGTFVNVTGDLQSATLRTGSATIGNTTFNNFGIIELNSGGTGDRNALIDFHSDDTYTDYSFRIIAASGANSLRQITARGTSGIQIQTEDAAPIYFSANTIEAVRITAGANVGIGNTAPNAKLQVTGTANISGNVVLGGDLTISTGVVTGNGFGLTSVNYLSQSTSAVDVEVFGNTSAGGNINTWRDGTRFYPTLPSNINTLDMNIYTELFIRQVSDAVPNANLSGAAGPGNPQLAYRVIKVPTAGANTTLLTADWQTISVPGSASFFLNSIRDTTPTSGNTVGYLLQYQWRAIDSDPNANAGTISIANTSTTNVTGVGTYFTSKLNTRLDIAPANASAIIQTYKAITTIFGNRLLQVNGVSGAAQTAVSYRVRDPYANVSIAQTNVAFNFIGYK